MGRVAYYQIILPDGVEAGDLPLSALVALPGVAWRGLAAGDLAVLDEAVVPSLKDLADLVIALESLPTRWEDETARDVVGRVSTVLRSIVLRPEAT
jgi:hypothetical protein